MSHDQKYQNISCKPIEFIRQALEDPKNNPTIDVKKTTSLVSDIDDYKIVLGTTQFTISSWTELIHITEPNGFSCSVYEPDFFALAKKYPHTKP